MTFVISILYVQKFNLLVLKTLTAVNSPNKVFCKKPVWFVFVLWVGGESFEYTPLKPL